MDELLIIAAVGLGITLYGAVILISGMMRMGQLKLVDPLVDADCPQVSIIVPACNEEKTIVSAVRSFLAQDYRNLEVIVIDDRSTDKTFEKMRSLQEQHPSLHVHRITDLPAGWLGKSHALHYGAGLARGDYLLFTDADIHLEKSTVARAVAYMEEHETDHLSLFFKHISSGWLLDSLILDGGAGLLLMFRPWKVGDPQSNSFVGIGAFNMVRRDVYNQVGGHSSIRMHPIDDIMLGKIIKRNGKSQQCLLALDFVSVRWYESVSHMISGLMKNLFSLFHYRLTAVFCVILMSVVVHIVPFWGALFSSGISRLLFLMTVATRLIAFTYARYFFKVSPLCIPGSLVSPYFNVFTLIRATWLTVRNKGILWRTTFYPLSELKKSEPILSVLHTTWGSR